MARPGRTPSPPYPAVSLDVAVERVRPALEAGTAGRHLEREQLHRALGFSTVNGTSKSFVNALRQYGIVRSDHDGFRLEDIGAAITDDGAPRDRLRVLTGLAWRPEIFQKLQARFGDEVGEDHKGARALLAEAGFGETAVQAVLRSYRGTVDYLRAEQARALDQAGDTPESGTSDGASVEGRDEDIRATKAGPDRPSGMAWFRRAAGTSHASARRPERTLLAYAFEDGGDLRMMIHGETSVSDVLDVVGRWLDAKREEVARAATSARDGPVGTGAAPDAGRN